MAEDDRFVAEAQALSPRGRDLVAALALALPQPAAPAALRRRLLAALSDAGRFDRFIGPVARMADLPEAAAKALLDALWTDPWEPAPLVPHVSTRWVAGGPRARGAIRGFLRVPAGLAFPEHEHLGDEEMVILQGYAVVDDGRVYGPGETLAMKAGSAHAFAAMEGAADLVYFAVAHEGVRAYGVDIRHTD